MEDQIQKTNILKMLLDDFFLYKIALNTQKNQNSLLQFKKAN